MDHGTALPRLGAERQTQIDVAEARSGEILLAEAQAAAEYAGVTMIAAHMLGGRPEKVIVEQAAQGFDLVAVSACEGIRAALVGPQSVGHVARYVLDHAPCDVLLRQYA